MAKIIGIAILIALVVGGLVALIIAYVGGPSWMAGAAAAAAGGAACLAFGRGHKK